MPRTSRVFLISFTAVLLTTLATSPAARADRRPHAGMMRYPDVSVTQIVFSYRGGLWLVPRDGGLATPLTSPGVGAAFPRFSPDGRSVAFAANYGGNQDLYTIPLEGGVPVCVTHHPTGEILCDWTPDGQRLLFFASGYGGLARQQDLLTVAVTGGMPEKLPVPYGALGSISPDGTWLAYTPHTVDFSTWKRYMGGMATDIWLFNLRDHTSKKITDWAGTDSQPMWHGEKIYYLSDDGPTHRMNIWVYDTKSGQRAAVTDFKDFDVKWPAIGPGPTGDGEIVFQNGAKLYLLDLKTGRSRSIDVMVPGDLPAIRPQHTDVRGFIASSDISATGKRAVFEARGDIWTVPAEKGSPRNLTRTSGVAERSPSWSPDGRWIVYFSDATGEYELYLRQSDGQGEARQLTHDGNAYRIYTTWSPDSKHILFTDKTGALYLYTLPSDIGAEKKDADADKDAGTQPTTAAGEVKLIDTDPWAAQPQASWSHDSNWIAYSRTGDITQMSIWLYHVPTAEKHQVTTGMFNDSWPAFDRKGDYLYFASNRRFENPIYEDIGNSFVYTSTDTLVVVPLRAEVGSPWAPKSDEETWKDDAKDKEKDKEEKKEGESKPKEQPKDDAAPKADEEQSAEKPADQAAAESKPADKADEKKDDKKDEKKPLKIELDDFELRAVLLPVPPGAFTHLAVNSDGKLLYVRQGRRGRDGPPAIKLFDIHDEKKEEKTVLDGSGGFSLSADGKKLLVAKDGTFAIVDAAADQKFEKTLPLDGLSALIDPRAEWRQLFIEAWRLQRDFFYDPNMHGVNWPAMRDHYIKMIDDCVSRADVTYVIRELIAELNVGHAYYWGGGPDDTREVPVGLLGCDFELQGGAYRIQKIIHGGVFDLDARGPLSQPGINVREGDYLLALNGVPIDVTQDPWAAFQALPPGRTVTLTVSDKPVLELKPATAPATGEKKEGDEKDKDKDEKSEETGPTYTGQRDVLVTLIDSGRDMELRYRAWVEKNRAYVAQQSNNQIGYIHVPDTGIDGQNELFRQFYGQRGKAALIIDERWNGGGQLPHRFIELLNRPMTNYWARRDGRDWPSPDDAHPGPKCMLINGLAGSGGDAFPFYFRQARLGKLIGMRTWGGLVGISGNPSLIDGAVVTVPTFAFFKLNGTWGVEGHGVDPDVEVIDDPALMVDGGDPQLDQAIELMKTEIARNPYVPPKRPPYPDRSGMGVPEKDR
ncbi:MAG: PD40 domain-containing protein [Phycisphaerae bacterium]|nr:PD40 domain-containing protein [Phycisphaerae bacterium]